MNQTTSGIPIKLTSHKT